MNDSLESLPCLSHAKARAAFAPCMVTCDRLSRRGQISAEPMRSRARLVVCERSAEAFSDGKLDYRITANIASFMRLALLFL